MTESGDGKKTRRDKGSRQDASGWRSHRSLNAVNGRETAPAPPAMLQSSKPKRGRRAGRPRYAEFWPRIAKLVALPQTDPRRGEIAGALLLGLSAVIAEDLGPGAAAAALRRVASAIGRPTRGSGRGEDSVQ